MFKESGSSNDNSSDYILDENADLKARILRLESEISQLRRVLDTVKTTLNMAPAAPGPLVANDSAAFNLVKTGIFKPGTVINVGPRKMYVCETGGLLPVKNFPSLEKYRKTWGTRDYFNNDLNAGDCVSIDEKLYLIEADGGLKPL